MVSEAFSEKGSGKVIIICIIYSDKINVAKMLTVHQSRGRVYESSLYFTEAFCRVEIISKPSFKKIKNSSLFSNL